MATRLPESSRGRVSAFLALLAVALVATAAASAGSTPPLHLTAADQALARSLVVRQSDLGSASVWHGGMKKPDLSAGPNCPSYHPEESDLPVTGAAESDYTDQAAAVEYDSEAEILQTAKMVQLDWQRSVQPGLITCLRSTLEKGLPASETLVSVGRVAVPKISTHAAEYRIVFDVHRTTAPKTVRLMTDILLVGHDRAEINLTTTAPYVARGPVEQSELRLARILVARIPTTA
jgi:hypothetical protein